MENEQLTREVNLQQPSRKLPWIIALVILALVLGAVYYLFFFKGEETPPSLTTQRSTYQGLMQKELSAADASYKFLSFDEADQVLYKTHYEDKKTELMSQGLSAMTLPYTDVNDGMHYAAFESDMTFEKIVRAINPSKTEAIIVATWDPAGNNGQGIWVITDNTYFTTSVNVIKNEDLGKYTVPAGKAVIVGGTDDIEIWGAKDGKTKLGKNFPICNQTSKGWYSYILNVDKLSELENTPCFSGIKYIYVQKDESQLTTATESKFELAYKAGVTPIENLQTYQLKNYIAWMDFDEAPMSIAIAQAQAQNMGGSTAGSTVSQGPAVTNTDEQALAGPREATAVQIIQEALGYDETTGTNYGALDETGKAMVNDVIKDIQNEVSANSATQSPEDTCELLGFYFENYIDAINSDPDNTDPHIEIIFDTKRASGSNSIVLNDVTDFTPISGPLNGAFNKAKSEYTPRTGYLGEDFIVFERESDYNSLLYCLDVVAEPQGGAAFTVGTGDGSATTQEPATTPQEASSGVVDGGSVGDTVGTGSADTTGSASINVDEVSTIIRTEDIPASSSENIYPSGSSSIGSDGSDYVGDNTETNTPAQFPAPTNLSVSESRSGDNDKIWFMNVTWDAPEPTEGTPALSGYVLTWCQKGNSDSCPKTTKTKMKLPANYVSTQIPKRGGPNNECMPSDYWIFTLTATFGTTGTPATATTTASLSAIAGTSQTTITYKGCSNIK